MDLKQNNLTKKAMKVSAGALATLSILSNSAFALSPRDIVKKAKSLVAPTVAAVATTAAAASVIGVTGVLVWKLIDLKGEEVEVPIDINDLIDKIDLTTRKKMLESFKSVGECLRLEEKEAFKRSYASLEKNVREDDYESKFEENYKKPFLCCMGFALGVQSFTDNNDNRTLSNEERILNCIKSAIEDGKINVPNKPQSMGEQQPEENKDIPKEESVVQPDPALQPVEDEGTVSSKAEVEIGETPTEEDGTEKQKDIQATEENEGEDVAPVTVEDKSKQEVDAKSGEEQKVGSDTAAEEKKTEESSVEKAPVEENNTPVVDEAKKEDKLPEEVITVNKEVGKERKPLTKKEKTNIKNALEAFRNDLKQVKKGKNFDVVNYMVEEKHNIRKSGRIIKLLEIMVNGSELRSEKGTLEEKIDKLAEDSDLVYKLVNSRKSQDNDALLGNFRTILNIINGEYVDERFYGNSLDASIKDDVYSTIKSMCSFLGLEIINGEVTIITQEKM